VFRQVAPDRLQIREGGGCLSLFGLPFFAAGVFLLLAASDIIPVDNADELPWFGRPLLVLMGLAFTGVGGTLAFGRSWTTLDSTQRVVIRRTGLLVPLRERRLPLDDYTAVTLGIVHGDSDSPDQYPVGLKARAGADLRLSSVTSYRDARETAAAVARHLHWPLEDNSTDNPVTLPAAEIDRPLQHRWREREQTGDVPRPEGARSTITHEADHTRIVLPYPRMHPVMLAVGLLPLAIPLFVAPSLARFFRDSQTPDLVAWLFLAFLGFGFGVLPLLTIGTAFLRSRRGGTIVGVSPRGILVQERGAWRTRIVAEIDATDILDVDYSTRATVSALDASPPISPRMERVLTSLSRLAKGRGVIVKSRSGLTTFGQGLDDQEIRYVHGLVRRVLAG
jgi:hypothetical protein